MSKQVTFCTLVHAYFDYQKSSYNLEKPCLYAKILSKLPVDNFALFIIADTGLTGAANTAFAYEKLSKTYGLEKWQHWVSPWDAPNPNYGKKPRLRVIIFKVTQEMLDHCKEVESKIHSEDTVNV